MSGTDRITLKIDLRAGVIDLDAPAAEFDRAIEKTRELTSSLDFGRASAPAGVTAEATSPLPAEAPGPVRTSVIQAAKDRGKGKAQSAGRAGRIGSFEPDRTLLTEAQHKELHEFFGKKAPQTQDEQVLVGAYKGAALLGRQDLTYNEIYTLMWRGGVDPLPKAIDVVIQKLIQEQKMDKSGSGYFVRFLGQSLVDNDLPRPGKSAA